MHIEPFATEHYFGLYEFGCPHMLSASDCESISIAELVQLAGASMDTLGQLQLRYVESEGSPEIRAAISAQYASVDPSEILTLSAPEEGIYITMRALLEPGDDVVVLSPCYDSLANVATHIGAHVHRVSLEPRPQGWSLPWDALIDLLRRVEPRLLILNFPHNPTGYLPPEPELQALLRVTAELGTWVFSDEMYRGLELDPLARQPSLTDLHERTIVLSGLSKAHGLPGLRAGWLVVRDPELAGRITNWKLYTTICSPVASQWLATLALGVADRLVARSLTTIRNNLELAEAFFARWSEHLVWRPPAAGSVALVETRHEDAGPYCHALAKRAGVVLLPGACVGAPPGYVRMGFGRTGFGEHLAALEADLRRHS
ncbi:MAG: pyridoxal phosphate-dependent aminotransferase [Myxococcota bacterium]